MVNTLIDNKTKWTRIILLDELVGEDVDTQFLQTNIKHSEHYIDLFASTCFMDILKMKLQEKYNFPC